MSTNTGRPILIQVSPSPIHFDMLSYPDIEKEGSKQDAHCSLIALTESSISIHWYPLLFFPSGHAFG